MYGTVSFSCGVHVGSMVVSLHSGVATSLSSILLDGVSTVAGDDRAISLTDFSGIYGVSEGGPS